MLDFRIAKDEASIERIVEAISVHINPWSVDNSEGIVSLTSGVVATTQRDEQTSREPIVVERNKPRPSSKNEWQISPSHFMPL